MSFSIYRAAMLDFDGLLTRGSFEHQRVANLAIFERAGVEMPSLHTFVRDFDLPFIDFYNKHGVSFSEAEIWSIFREHYGGAANCPLEDEALPLLEILTKKLKHVAIVSMSKTETVLTRFPPGFCEEFGVEVHGGALDKAGRFQSLLKKWCMRPMRTLCIGDMGFDIRAAFRAGMGGMGYSGQHQQSAALHEAGAPMIFGSLGDLIRFCK